MIIEEHPQEKGGERGLWESHEFRQEKKKKNKR